MLKNPWTHLRWKGRYSENDAVSWTPALCKALDYDPNHAKTKDDGGWFIYLLHCCGRILSGNVKVNLARKFVLCIILQGDDFAVLISSAILINCKLTYKHVKYFRSVLDRFRVSESFLWCFLCELESSIVPVYVWITCVSCRLHLLDKNQEEIVWGTVLISVHI